MSSIGESNSFDMSTRVGESVTDIKDWDNGSPHRLGPVPVLEDFFQYHGGLEVPQ